MVFGWKPRLRTPPSVRFAPRVERVDLDDTTEMLMREPASGQHGHRQITLFRHGPSTLALYCFEARSRLHDHVIDGPVIIHSLQGHLTVTADGHEYELTPGTLLRLAPGVRHDVLADEPSRMLLTVCVEGPGSHAGR